MKVWKEFISEITQHVPSEVECEIKMMNSKNSLTRFANSHIHQNVEEETSDIYLTLHKDKRTITLTSNLTSIDNPKNLCGIFIGVMETKGIESISSFARTLEPTVQTFLNSAIPSPL